MRYFLVDDFSFVLVCFIWMENGTLIEMQKISTLRLTGRQDLRKSTERNSVSLFLKSLEQ